MCGQVEDDLLTGSQWKCIKKRVSEAGIRIKEKIPCSNDRLLFYKSIVNMSVQDLKNHFNNG
jgi:hypothetical protein